MKNVPKTPERPTREGTNRTARRKEDLLAALRTDPRVAPAVDDYERAGGAGKGRSFGSNALKVRGKIFAIFTRDTLVVKLPAERVDALVAEGVGERFDPGHGRLMKGWLSIVSPRASWVDFAKESHAFVSGAKPR
jgi:hypothetical protein